MHVLPIGIGWLQKDEQQGNTDNRTCASTMPHKIGVLPSGSLPLYCS